MRRIALFVVMFMFSADCVSQPLEGEWKGYFTIGGIEFTKTEIFINFHKINDTTFEAYTKTVMKNDTAICILTGGFLKKNILYLEETRTLKDFAGAKGPPCLQMFKLYYRQKKGNLILDGNWVSRNEKCGGGGTIRLIKN